jgi:hypothetical protein
LGIRGELDGMLFSPHLELILMGNAKFIIGLIAWLVLMFILGFNLVPYIEKVLSWSLTLQKVNPFSQISV